MVFAISKRNSKKKNSSGLFRTSVTWHPEKAMAPHSSTLAWKIPWTEEPGRLQSMGSLRVRHYWVTSLLLFTFMHRRRKWQPTPRSCLENPRDGGACWAAVYGVAHSRTWLTWLSSSSSNMASQKENDNSSETKIKVMEYRDLIENSKSRPWRNNELQENSERQFHGLRNKIGEQKKYFTKDTETLKKEPKKFWN